MHGFFRLSRAREDTFVAGLSMGGYGAMKWALRCPERFAAAASLSGALDMARMQREASTPEDRALHARIYGEAPIAGTPDDVLDLLRTADPASLPALMVRCGTEDFLYADNLTFRDTCARWGIPLDGAFGPGDHEWSYWDATIQEVLAWLPLRG